RNHPARRWFHEKHQSMLCRKRSFPALGGRGVIPLPPLLLFFRRGSPPHPQTGQAGVPPPPPSRPDPIIHIVAAMSPVRAIGSRACHDLVAHGPADINPGGGHTRLNGGSEN